MAQAASNKAVAGFFADVPSMNSCMGVAPENIEG